LTSDRLKTFAKIVRTVPIDDNSRYAGEGHGMSPMTLQPRRRFLSGSPFVRGLRLVISIVSFNCPFRSEKRGAPSLIGPPPAWSFRGFSYRRTRRTCMSAWQPARRPQELRPIQFD